MLEKSLNNPTLFPYLLHLFLRLLGYATGMAATKHSLTML